MKEIRREKGKTPRKQFTAPKLEKHEELPVITAGGCSDIRVCDQAT